jgi:NADH-quinone oxidoreductase subunit J
MVLFLFVVMMLDINLDKLREGFWKSSWLGMAVGVAMLLEMAFLVMSPAFSGVEAANQVSNQPGYSNIKELGRLIYTDYAIPFELAALILLVAIVAAIALTLRGRKDAKTQDPAAQVRVKARDRLRIISMDAEPRPGAKAATEGEAK